MVWSWYRLWFYPAYRNNISTNMYLLVKCLGLVQFLSFTFKWRMWYAFLMSIQMDSMAFDLYSDAHGEFTFNSSLNFPSSDFLSRYLLYFSLKVILFLTISGCLQWNKKWSTLCTSLQYIHLPLWTCLYRNLLFLQSQMQFMSSRSLVTVLLMLEDSIVDKYFVTGIKYPTSFVFSELVRYCHNFV